MKIIAKWFVVVKYYLVNPFTKGKCLDGEHVHSLFVTAALPVQM